MGPLSGEITISGYVPLPAGANEADSRSLLQNHDFYFSCSPVHKEHKEIPTTEKASIPDGVKALGETKTYDVHDFVKNVPKGLWDSNVNSKVQITNTETGIWMHTESPLSMVVETEWKVEVQDGQAVLARESVCKANKVLLAAVKSIIVDGLVKIQENIVDELAKQKN